MIYWRLLFHGGPWDGQELEVAHDPQKIDLCIAPQHRSKWSPHAYEMWTYTPGKVEGEVFHMDGKKTGGSQ